jgi:hypothetical protein
MRQSKSKPSGTRNPWKKIPSQNPKLIPPYLGSYTIRGLVSQERRHLFVTPLATTVYQTERKDGGHISCVHYLVWGMEPIKTTARKRDLIQDMYFLYVQYSWRNPPLLPKYSNVVGRRNFWTSKHQWTEHEMVNKVGKEASLRGGGGGEVELSQQNLKYWAARKIWNRRQARFTIYLWDYTLKKDHWKTWCGVRVFEI